MPTSVKRAGFWDDRVWAAIDDGVKKAVGAIRVAQKVFPSIQLANANAVPAESFDRARMRLTEGLTKPYIELSVTFSLTNGQVNADATGAAAINLASRAATYLANAEDLTILQGAGWAPPGAAPPLPVPPPVAIVSGGGSIVKDGIVGMAPRPPIAVNPAAAPPPPAAPPRNSGGNILTAVQSGIARLTGNLQTPPFALILSTDAYAAVSGSVINAVPTKNVLEPLLTGGIYGTAAMPANTGVLIALGGDPTTIYFASDPVTEPTYQQSSGEYSFRTFVRIQYTARDPDAFVELDFT
jgi:Encapsulating protein for peroxidase